MADITCQHCKRDFSPRVGPGRPRQYCSRICRQRAYEGRVWGHTWPLLVDIAERDGHVCPICSEPIDLTVETGDMCPSFDHRVPTIYGGRTIEANLRVVHWICNQRKGEGH